MSPPFGWDGSIAKQHIPADLRQGVRAAHGHGVRKLCLKLVHIGLHALLTAAIDHGDEGTADEHAVRAQGQSLENDRDVLKILTSYRRVAGKDFGAELDQTIADMKTGNYENALIRFETRIGSPMLSDVIRGLIGVLRGDDQRMYFKMITFDMRQIEQNNLKKEAAKRPKKIQRYSMMMLICIMIIYLVVLCTEVMSSLGAFFG